MKKIELNTKIKEIMDLLRENNCEDARTKLDVILEYFSEKLENDKTPLPDEVETLYKIVELVQAGGKPPK